jgi:hypothetical protein
MTTNDSRKEEQFQVALQLYTSGYTAGEGRKLHITHLGINGVTQFPMTIAVAPSVHKVLKELEQRLSTRPPYK